MSFIGYVPFLLQSLFQAQSRPKIGQKISLNANQSRCGFTVVPSLMHCHVFLVIAVVISLLRQSCKGADLFRPQPENLSPNPA